MIDKRNLIATFAVFIFVMAGLLLCNLNSMQSGFSSSLFRYGMIPWSDASAWFNGARQLASGELITDGVASYRPLYSIWLAILIIFCGNAYFPLAILQMIFQAATVALAYGLLLPVRPRWAVIFFLSMVCVWRTDVAATMMTENLGIYLNLLAMAFFWRSIQNGDEVTYWKGLFLFGVGQFVRPWCLVALATLPLLPFFRPGTALHRRIRLIVLCCLFTGLGVGVHFAAKHSFAIDTRGSLNSALSLYGRVCGWDWMAAFSDPDFLAGARDPGRSWDDIADQLRRKTVSIVLANPWPLLSSTFKNLMKTFTGLQSFFPETGLTGAAMFLGWLMFFRLIDWGLFRTAMVKRNSLRKLYPFLLLSSVILIGVNYWGVALAVFGLYTVVRSDNRQLKAWIGLFGLGIFVSLFIVGTDGGARVRIAGDLFMFILAGLGWAGWLRKADTGSFSDNVGQVAVAKFDEKSAAVRLLWLPLVFYLFFLAIPAVNLRLRTAPAPVKLIPEKIAAELRLEHLPFAGRNLESVAYYFPGQSYEIWAGKWACLPLFMLIDDLIWRERNHEKVLATIPDRYEYYWPAIRPFVFNRTIYLKEMNCCIFPGVNPEQLYPWVGKNLLVVGRMIVANRIEFYHTGFAVLVKYVGYAGTDGSVVWLELKNGKLVPYLPEVSGK